MHFKKHNYSNRKLNIVRGKNKYLQDEPLGGGIDSIKKKKHYTPDSIFH